MAEPLYQIVESTVNMPTASVQYSFAIPDQARNGLVIARTAAGVAVAFRVSPTAGVVAGGGGVPVAAGQPWEWSSPMLGNETTIYLAHAEVGGAVAVIQYELPATL